MNLDGFGLDGPYREPLPFLAAVTLDLVSSSSEG